MKQILIALVISGTIFTNLPAHAADKEQTGMTPEKEESFSLITENAEEGFQLAITLARKGVTETQSDREILFEQREVYAKDAELLIAASQVIAIHFQTIAAANNFWIPEE